MTYAELLAEIKLLSKRGDIDDKIATALRMTTLRCHRSDLFYRDLQEAVATFGNTQLVSIDVSVSLTRFRQLAYVQYYDPTSGRVGKMLDEVEPSNVLDEYNYFKTDMFYMAGTNININFCTPVAGAKLGYYQNPDVTVGGYNSWIAVELPDILVQGSLAYVLNLIGKNDEARMIDSMVGLNPDPKNKFEGPTLLDQLKAIGIRSSGRAF